MTAIDPSLDPDDRLKPDYLYRDDMVYITDGTKAVHQGLPADLLNDAMKQFVLFAGKEPQESSLITAAALHFQIAYLHPFFDGNGCMARMIQLWYLLQQGFSSALSLPLSSYINSSRSAYFKSYQLIEHNARISGIIDITPFISYFIQNVYGKLAPETALSKASFKYSNLVPSGEITEKEQDLWEFVLSHYGTEPFSTKKLERAYDNAAYATIRSFVLKFTEYGLLGVQHLSNQNHYNVR